MLCTTAHTRFISIPHYVDTHSVTLASPFELAIDEFTTFAGLARQQPGPVLRQTLIACL